jgi:hypothetical protein
MKFNLPINLILKDFIEFKKKTKTKIEKKGRKQNTIHWNSDL